MASGEVRTTKVCAHMTPGLRKARPWLDGACSAVWVPATNRSSAMHVKQRNDTTARQRSARGDDGSGTCKRPARLDGRLSSDDGSARRHKQAAGKRHTASSQGSVQPQLEGRVHNTEKRVVRLTCALDAMTRRWRRAAWNDLEQGKQSGADRGFHSGISLAQQPWLLLLLPCFSLLPSSPSRTGVCVAGMLHFTGCQGCSAPGCYRIHKKKLTAPDL
jgi:hypothetical protein